MAFTWRTSKAGNTGGVQANFTITEPTSIASGDFEFVVVSGGPGTGTVTTPTGWTKLGDAAGTNAHFYVFYVTGGRGASAPTLTFTTSGGTGGWEWVSCAVAGSNHTIDASATTTLSTLTNPDAPSATASFTNDEAIAIGFNWTGSGTAWGAPTGYTIRSVNTAGLDEVVASKDLAASGAENPAAFTGGGGANDTWAVTLLLENSTPTGGGATTWGPWGLADGWNRIVQP